MTKLTHTNTPRATGAALSPAVAVIVRASARPSHDRIPSVRLIGKTVLFAIEVVEIVGLGLALL